jgi:hypothetical protein
VPYFRTPEKSFLDPPLAALGSKIIAAQIRHGDETAAIKNRYRVAAIDRGAKTNKFQSVILKWLL